MANLILPPNDTFFFEVKKLFTYNYFVFHDAGTELQAS